MNCFSRIETELETTLIRKKTTLNEHLGTITTLLKNNTKTAQAVKKTAVKNTLTSNYKYQELQLSSFKDYICLHYKYY